MAKITRKAAKIFASSAGTNERAQIGSLAASAPAYSTDLDVIQSLTEYLGGWFDCVIGANSPAIEDMNSLCYVFAYQIAYLLQTGVAEYNATTAYYTGSIVSDGTGIMYVSLTDANTGNALTDFTNWFTPTQNGALIVTSLAGTAMTLPASKTMSVPNMTIPTGQTITVPTGAFLLAATSITIAGTGVLLLTGTGESRIF